MGSQRVGHNLATKQQILKVAANQIIEFINWKKKKKRPEFERDLESCQLMIY